MSVLHHANDELPPLSARLSAPPQEGPFLVTADTITDSLRSALAQQTLAKNQAYTERNTLVAALSKLFPASLEPHQQKEGEVWDPKWAWVCIIDLPTGQASWHIQTDELHLFDHLPRNAGRAWDGHDTPEKYRRLNAMPDHLLRQG